MLNNEDNTKSVSLCIERIDRTKNSHYYWVTEQSTGFSMFTEAFPKREDAITKIAKFPFDTLYKEVHRKDMKKYIDALEEYKRAAE